MRSKCYLEIQQPSDKHHQKIDFEKKSCHHRKIGHCILYVCDVGKISRSMADTVHAKSCAQKPKISFLGCWIQRKDEPDTFLPKIIDILWPREGNHGKIAKYRRLHRHVSSEFITGFLCSYMGNLLASRDLQRRLVFIPIQFTAEHDFLRWSWGSWAFSRWAALRLV